MELSKGQRVKRSEPGGSIVERLCRVLALQRERGQLDQGLDPEVIAVAITAMVEEFASRWLALGRSIGATEISQLTELWAGGLYGSETRSGSVLRGSARGR
jgi:hypothetical protein